MGDERTSIKSQFVKVGEGVREREFLVYDHFCPVWPNCGDSGDPETEGTLIGAPEDIKRSSRHVAYAACQRRDQYYKLTHHKDATA